jgi:hypothetical protein
MKNNLNLLSEAQNGKLTNLTSISGSHKLNSDASSDYKKMVDAAKKDGISWTITDSYRPYDIQDKIFDWDYFNKTGKKRKKGTSGTPVAYPGTSNHGWGSAVDLGVKYGDKAHTWLVDNASEFGFSNPFNNPRTEPWHWEHLSSAKQMKSGAKPVKELPSDIDDTKIDDTKIDDSKDTDKKIEFDLDDNFDLLGLDPMTKFLKDVMSLKKESVNEDVVRIKEIMKKVL